jgi:excisionase family DNA binding protein
MKTHEASLPIKSNDSLMDPEELAQVLNVKKSWVYWAIHCRSLPVPIVRVGRYPRFRRVDVERFIQEQATAR